eukprot:1156328-Pelagomonas_calceolata.AAC.1
MSSQMFPILKEGRLAKQLRLVYRTLLTKYSLIFDKDGLAAAFFSVSSRSSMKWTVAPDSLIKGR